MYCYRKSQKKNNQNNIIYWFLLVNNEQYNCLVLERYRNESNRTVKYYLAEELDFMFVKIIDKNPDRTNTLELLEILSFG